MKTLLTLLSFSFFISLSAQKDVTLRLNPSFYDESRQTVYVDIELQYNGSGAFRLADQNYRLYFDSELMTIDEDYSRSDLPQDVYSALAISEIYEGLDADRINQLDFDDKLGFINFNIDLINTQQGGIVFRQDDLWHRVAVLAFKVEDKESLSQIVWSRPEMTDEYATAFVEIMEWVAPNKTEVASIEDYVDASFSLATQDHSYDVAVYPNPSSDFIKITFDEEISQDINIKVYDTAGRSLMSRKALKGDIDVALTIADLQEGSYNIEIISTNDQKVGRTSFIKVGS